MNIVFLCGSLEPGRDGVGDYTRRLACEIIRQGHRAAIIALNDQHLADRVVADEKEDRENRNVKSSRIGYVSNVAGFQTSDGTEVPVLRMSRGIQWSNRMRMAKLFVDSQNPDFLSLQYVPYSFHPKGIPFGLPTRLASLGVGRKWQVMFHELWVGLGISPPWKHRILRGFQMNVVKGLLRLLNPLIIHTQSTPYVQLLEELYPNVELLPLFSNIPFLWCGDETEQRGIVRFAFFGSVHGSWDIQRTVSVVQKIAEFQGKRAELIAIGDASARASQTWNVFRELGVEVLEMGRLGVNEVSKELSAADYGISASVPDLIQKSGSAAAMFEHGLPVLITGSPIWGDRFLDSIRESCPLAIFGADLSSPQNIVKCSVKTNVVGEVATQFIQNFETSRRRITGK
jgi:hypothetical protein